MSSLGWAGSPALPGPEVAGLVGAGPSLQGEEEEGLLSSHLGGHCGL